jgi:hypothetical protein
MSTCHVVATTTTIARMAHRAWARQEARLGGWLGVGIASSRAVSVERRLRCQLVGEPITLNLAIGLVAVFAGIWIATTDAAKVRQGSAS